MLTKILFTGLVIVVVFAVARFRTRIARPPPPVLEPMAPSARPRSRVVAYLLAVALTVGAVLGYVYFWTAWHEVVTVKVINAQNGETVTYQAYKGSIHEREFETTDGWKVAVSDGERVEIKRGVQ